MTDLQLRILRLLWSHDHATAAEIQARLRPEHDLAATTVSTHLGRLVKRGLVGMRRDGRQFRYTALVAEADLASQALGEVTELLFAGNASLAISHLLDTSKIDDAELDTLRRRLDAMMAQAQPEERKP